MPEDSFYGYYLWQTSSLFGMMLLLAAWQRSPRP